MTNRELLKLKKRYIAEGYKRGLKEAKAVHDDGLDMYAKTSFARLALIKRLGLNDIKKALMDMDEKDSKVLFDGLNKFINYFHK